MDIDISNTYDEYSQDEIINRCDFGNIHLMNTISSSGNAISQQQEPNRIIDSTR